MLGVETERRKDTCRSQWGSPPLTQPLTTFPAPTSASQAFSFLRPQGEPYAWRPGKMKSCLMQPSARSSLGGAPICRAGLKQGKAINVLP